MLQKPVQRWLLHALLITFVHAGKKCGTITQSQEYGLQTEPEVFCGVKLFEHTSVCRLNTVAGRLLTNQPVVDVAKGYTPT